MALRLTESGSVWRQFFATRAGEAGLNEHIAEPGDVVFRHACALGLEGIVSKQARLPVRPLARVRFVAEPVALE